MFRTLSAICVILLLGGCTTPKLNVITAPVDIPIVQPDAPRAPTLNSVNFRVVTKNNLNAFLSEMSKKQDSENPVFVAMTISDYETLSLNMSELKRYIEQQNAIVVYYKNATTPQNKEPTK